MQVRPATRKAVPQSVWDVDPSAIAGQPVLVVVNLLDDSDDLGVNDPLIIQQPANEASKLVTLDKQVLRHGLPDPCGPANVLGCCSFIDCL